MSEMLESARRWTGYVCPDCRFVFRVPRDHDGEGIVCPSCRRMLRIPGATDLLPRLVAPLRQTSVEVSEPDVEQTVVKKRRRGRKIGSSDDHSWEQQQQSGQFRRHEGGQKRQLWIGGSALFVLLGVGVFFSVKGGEKPAMVSKKDLPTPVVAAKKADLVVGKRSEDSILTEAEPLTRKFLAATTVSELLPLIRHPEITEPRMRALYPDGKIEAPGMSKFNSSGAISVRDKLASLMVTTRDQVEKPLAFLETPQGLKIDWESWAGWSEMSWAKFLSTKPSTAQVFRVTLSAVDYYNFDFSDEVKWQSYRLISPDQEHSLYGYVEKGSTLDQKVILMEDAKVVKLMLSLKFPIQAVSSGQVEIVGIVTEGWVEDESK